MTLTRSLLVALLAAAVVSASAVAGNGGTLPITLSLQSGGLTVKAAAVTVSSATQVPITVTDARGNGNGWTLSASKPVQVSGITARCATGSTCTLPTVSTTPSGRIVLHADAASGMGVIKLTVTLSAADPVRVSFRIA
jgi:hypothetical protein